MNIDNHDKTRTIKTRARSFVRNGRLSWVSDGRGKIMDSGTCCIVSSIVMDVESVTVEYVAHRKT